MWREPVDPSEDERDRDAMTRLWRAVRTDVPASALAPFRTTGRLAVPEAIAIYKNAYWIRQHEALCDLFPRLRAHLGDARFRELVRRYLRACPSQHPELERLGSSLAAFLRGSPEAELARTATLAAYEQALVESFLARNSSTASLADIRPHTFAITRLVFAPSLRVVAVDDLLLRVLGPEIARAEEQDNVGAHAAVIARPRFATVTHLVDDEELELLTRARAGATIGELLERCAHDITGLHVPLARWFQRRWIAALHERSP